MKRIQAASLATCHVALALGLGACNSTPRSTPGPTPASASEEPSVERTEIEAPDAPAAGAPRVDVETIEFEPVGADVPVEVSLGIDRAVQSHIRADSVATIGTIGLLGDSYVEITVGSAEARMLQDGQEIEAGADIVRVVQLPRLQVYLREVFGRQLKLRNVQVSHADGSLGWPERSPFDGILAAAAPQRIPEELLQQLAPGGRLVIPVGGVSQHLHVVCRTHQGFATHIVEPVRFVPLRPGTAR